MSPRCVLGSRSPGLRRLLVPLALTVALIPTPATAQAPHDLVQGLADVLAGDLADGGTAPEWDPLPQAAVTEEAVGDVYTLDGGTAEDAPAFVDLVQGVQFGFTYPRSAWRALFGEGGPLACGASGVACPSYDTSIAPFREGAFAIGFQLAAEPDLSGGQTLNVATLAHDDDWPTFEDPRPGSPFVGVNEAWRLDLTQEGTALHYLQVVTGPFEEFRTDARVLLDGDRGWFLIPPDEFELAGTIDGFDVHTFFSPRPNAELPDQPADSGPQGDLATPIGTTGGLQLVEVAKPVSPSPTAEPRPTPAASPSPASAPTSAEGGITPWSYLVALGVLLMIAGFLVLPRPRLRPWRRPETGAAVTSGAPPVVVRETRRRRVRRVVEIDTAVELSDESRLQTVVETIEEEVEVAPPQPEPPRPPEQPEPPEQPPTVDVSDLTEVTPPPGTLAGVPTGIGIADTTPETPCLEEYRAWQTAEAACESARHAAEEAEARAEAVRQELERLRQEYPPLGFEQSDETVIEMADGMRMSDLDNALMRWDESSRPQPPRSKDPAERLRQTRERLERLRQEHARFETMEAELLARLAETQEAARRARTAADEACGHAEIARRAWLECVGAGTAGGGTTGPPADAGPEPPRPPAPPAPPEPGGPGPHPPEGPRRPGPPEAPGQPAPPKPRPPNPPEGSKPSPGGSETSTGCAEGETREVDVETKTIETLRRRGRAKLTIAGGIGEGLELEGPPLGVLSEASGWAKERTGGTRARSTLYTVDIQVQMERIVARCFRVERCVRGTWTSGPRRKDVSAPEFFDRRVVHRESLSAAELARVLARARNELLEADRKREQLDTFCSDAMTF